MLGLCPACAGVFRKELPEPPIPPLPPPRPVSTVQTSRRFLVSPSEPRTDALRMLAEAAARSKRKNVAYAREFVRDSSMALPATPLVRLIQGGRGGAVRLRLYLLLTMIATQHPFDIRNPRTTRTIARTLCLSRTGPRLVKDNLRWLEKNGFIAQTPRPGQTASIQLLDPLRSGAVMPDPRSNRPYLTIPIGFWSQGWLLALSPVADVVLFALGEALGGAKGPRYLTPTRRASYHMSHDTWTKGEAELADHGLLSVDRTLRGDDWDHWRLRNVYQLDLGLLATPVSHWS